MLQRGVAAALFQNHFPMQKLKHGVNLVYFSVHLQFTLIKYMK